MERAGDRRRGVPGDGAEQVEVVGVEQRAAARRPRGEHGDEVVLDAERHEPLHAERVQRREAPRRLAEHREGQDLAPHERGAHRRRQPVGRGQTVVRREQLPFRPGEQQPHHAGAERVHDPPLQRLREARQLAFGVEVAGEAGEGEPHVVAAAVEEAPDDVARAGADRRGERRRHGERDQRRDDAGRMEQRGEERRGEALEAEEEHEREGERHADDQPAPQEEGEVHQPVVERGGGEGQRHEDEERQRDPAGVPRRAAGDAGDRRNREERRQPRRAADEEPAGARPVLGVVGLRRGAGEDRHAPREPRGEPSHLDSSAQRLQRGDRVERAQRAAEPGEVDLRQQQRRGRRVGQGQPAAPPSAGGAPRGEREVDEQRGEREARRAVHPEEQPVDPLAAGRPRDAEQQGAGEAPRGVDDRRPALPRPQRGGGGGEQEERGDERADDAVPLPRPLGDDAQRERRRRPLPQHDDADRPVRLRLRQKVEADQPRVDRMPADLDEQVAGLEAGALRRAARIERSDHDVAGRRLDQAHPRTRRLLAPRALGREQPERRRDGEER